MENKILTSYSFIASLNENETDIYSAVYVPLCKRAMSIFAKNHTHGKDSDIQKVIDDEYGIKIPLVITQRLIVAIGKDLSRKEKEKFGYECFESGKSFQFNTYSFNSLEESYDRERRQTNTLQLAFNTFAEAEVKDVSTVPSFTEFILRYKNELSAFLSGRTRETKDLDVDFSYMPHVRFLQYIESNNDALYKVVEHIYIGAIIASYLEANIDIDAKMEKGVTYFLDTKVVLEALDLQNQEDTRPTLELLQLIRDSGGDIRILDVTLNEIKGIINTAINTFNKINPTTTINEACIRLGKNKSWLTKINGQLENYIVENLKVNFSTVPNNDIKEFSATEDVKDLQKIWYRKNTAAHDVIAYLYVRKRRKQDSDGILIQKASSWFITANKRLCNFNVSRKVNGHPCEIVMPQDLTSLLFLKNPQKYSNKISSIGLSELIAQTLFDEYPSKDIINEFDIAIKDNENITHDDYIVLLSAVSQESTMKIQKLLEENIEDKEKFNKDIHALIANERQKRSQIERQQKEAAEQHSKDVEEKRELAITNKKLLEKIDTLAKQVEELQQDYKSKKEENRKLKLVGWKTPRYIALILLLIACVLFFTLYFIYEDWDYNYAVQLLNHIDSLQGIKQDIAKGVMFTVHGGIFLFSINALVNLIMIDDERDKKFWFLKLIKKSQ